MTKKHESTHPLVRHKVSLLRKETTNSKDFRELIREISILLAYEATADMKAEAIQVETPLAMADGAELQEVIGLVPILRAGLGMVEGIWEMMPSAEVWHIGLFRDERTLKPVEYYNKLPVDPTVHVCLILDPMLATGGSASEGISRVKKWGVNKISLLCIIAAPEGITKVQQNHPDVDIFVCAIDECLNENAYIVPGLGDAGDRIFNTL